MLYLVIDKIIILDIEISIIIETRFLHFEELKRSVIVVTRFGSPSYPNGLGFHRLWKIKIFHYQRRSSFHWCLHSNYWLRRRWTWLTSNNQSLFEHTTAHLYLGCRLKNCNLHYNRNGNICYFIFRALFSKDIDVYFAKRPGNTLLLNRLCLPHAAYL